MIIGCFIQLCGYDSGKNDNLKEADSMRSAYLGEDQYRSSWWTTMIFVVECDGMIMPKGFDGYLMD